MRPRSKRIKISNDARVLRALRKESALSMRRAAELAGISASTISHIETGRMNPPKGGKLERLLAIYGGIRLKSFYERVRLFESRLTAREELLQLLERASTQQIQIILQIVKSLLNS